MPANVHRTVPMPCGICGVTFAARLCDMGTPRQGKFCSRKCVAVHRSRLSKERGICVTPESNPSERVRAQGLINMRVRRGAIARPSCCSECGKPGRVDAHHEDYAKPDEVEWLCRSCHMKRHWRRKVA